MKLTDKQIETLRLIEAGEVQEVLFGYGAWRIVGADPTVVGRLVRTLELAEWVRRTDGSNRNDCVLSPAGRAALAALGGGHE